MRQIIETKSIPVIILTALDSDEDIKKGLSLGANDYISKTQHTVAEIIEKVETFLIQGVRQNLSRIINKK